MSETKSFNELLLSTKKSVGLISMLEETGKDSDEITNMTIAQAVDHLTKIIVNGTYDRDSFNFSDILEYGLYMVHPDTHPNDFSTDKLMAAVKVLCAISFSENPDTDKRDMILAGITLNPILHALKAKLA